MVLIFFFTYILFYRSSLHCFPFHFRTSLRSPLRWPFFRGSPPHAGGRNSQVLEGLHSSLSFHTDPPRRFSCFRFCVRLLIFFPSKRKNPGPLRWMMLPSGSRLVRVAGTPRFSGWPFSVTPSWTFPFRMCPDFPPCLWRPFGQVKIWTFKARALQTGRHKPSPFWNSLMSFCVSILVCSFRVCSPFARSAVAGSYTNSWRLFVVLVCLLFFYRAGICCSVPGLYHPLSVSFFFFFILISHIKQFFFSPSLFFFLTQSVFLWHFFLWKSFPPLKDTSCKDWGSPQGWRRFWMSTFPCFSTLVPQMVSFFLPPIHCIFSKECPGTFLPSEDHPSRVLARSPLPVPDNCPPPHASPSPPFFSRTFSPLRFLITFLWTFFLGPGKKEPFFWFALQCSLFFIAVPMFHNSSVPFIRLMLFSWALRGFLLAGLALGGFFM